MKKWKTAAAAAAAMLLMVACQPRGVDTAADEAAIRDGSSAWMEAYNAGDADAIAAIYTEDAVVMPPGKSAWSGRAGIRDGVAADIEGARGAGISLQITNTDVGVSGDLGWDSGTWSATDANGETVDTGHYIAVWKKTDQGWKIHRDMWNSDQAPPAPEAPAEQPAG